MDKKLKRGVVQALSALLANPHLSGFLKGNIYQGPLKTACVPGLNCYSCPAATGACPIGAMQAVLGSRKYSFSFYVVGTICLFGVLLGRLICGWLCLFGLIQDLLYNVPLPKLRVPHRLDCVLRYFKYVVLSVLVLALPIFLNNEFGISQPYFCKWLCPVGTLEGGVPLVLLNQSLRETIGFLLAWKFAILLGLIVLSMLVYRPFCKYLCPLGAFYALFNKVSFVKIRVQSDRCVACGQCKKVCDMGVDVCQKPNSTECIRCGKCVDVCPTNALYLGVLPARQRDAEKPELGNKHG